MISALSLDKKQQNIVTISAFTAKGDLDNLKLSLHSGLDSGLTINEIKEILIQLYAYTGFPRSLNAINTLMSVLQIRQSQGVNDEVGCKPHALPDDKSRFELGDDIQQVLVGAPVSGPTFTFVPTIDAFLKEHLFADIFARGVLDFQSRELVTIAALASLGGVDAQLSSHVKIGLNIGLKADQLTDLITVLSSSVGTTEANNLHGVIYRLSID
jgi:4-carboxymuconolactone decarboxylase